MVNETGSPALRDLAPAEVIRIVKWRFRVCNFLFNIGAIWICAGGILILTLVLSHQPDQFSALAIIVLLIGFAIFSAAFALTLAIYRCPVCDKYLSRFRPDKRRCPGCDAQIKA